MKKGGTLTVSVEKAGEDWQINFADTGPGMSPQLVEKVFEPFQSQFEGGTGLGLAIVYQIVQAHEGKVWARSKVGEGSVFVLRLRRISTEQRVAQPQRTTTEAIAAQTAPVKAVSAAAGTGGGVHG
jgi:two-component system sensor histidine kinase PilS (NtrC family)